MKFVRRFLTTLAFLVVVVGAVATAKSEDPYKNTPRIVYVVGQPGWDDLDKDGEKRLLRVFSTLDEAQAAANGREVFRIKRHDLLGTPDGKAWLDRLQANPKEFLSTVIPWTEPGKLEATIKASRTGSDLGPKNPNFATEGRYTLHNPMKNDYLPGQLSDDYAAGVYYFKSDGPEADFIKDFRVKFVEGPGGDMIMVSASGNPIDTQKLTSDVKGKALFVMDAAGNFYLIALEWAPIGPLGYRQINHSSLPAGHPVAAAGQIEVHNGKIISIDNNSGHYAPSNKMLTQAVDALQGHRVAKGKYKVGFSTFAGDHPGREYIGLDPDGKGKVERGELGPPPPEEIVNKPTVETPRKPSAEDDAKLLNPDEPTPSVQLEVDRHAAETPPQPAAPVEPKRVEPPDPEMLKQMKTLIEGKTVDQIDAKFMVELYSMHPEAGKAIGQVLGDESMYDKNMKMGEVRKQMDLAVWKELLKTRGFKVEITNQGKANGARSDLDYTLYHIAEETGIPIKDLIAAHGQMWLDVHKIGADKLDIKVMNGDEFYPDWRNEALSEAEHRVRVIEVLRELRKDPAKYSVPGAQKEQVHNRALREGWTEVLGYDPELDKPGVPIEHQMIRDQGQTRDIANRYKGVHPQYNGMNSLGTLIQNRGEFFTHGADPIGDAIKRAKYFNRIINEGLGGMKCCINDYRRIMDSDLPDREKKKMQYLERTLGLLTDDNGKPLIDQNTLQKFRSVIDISMQIELDKTGNRKGEVGDFNQKRDVYFGPYKMDAEANIHKRLDGEQVAPEKRQAMVLDEQQRLFEVDQKRVMAEAVLAGLRHSVTRDLTPEGALRNRVRFDPATNKFVIDDPEAAKKVAFERATEVALFYELVNQLDDNIPEEKFMKLDMKKRALATAPNVELMEFYGALDEVDKAAIDKYLAGDPDSKVQRKVDDLLKKQQDRALELLVERKEKAVARARAKGVAVDPNSVSVEAVRDHIVEGRKWGLTPQQRVEFGAAYQALGTRLSGDFKEAFYNNASGLMMGSSAVNLIRAWQAGGSVFSSPVYHAVFSEAINYMPEYIQAPFGVIDMLAKVRQGQYTDAAWQGSLLATMHFMPGLGNAMLAYNVVTGTIDIVHTHFVNRIDVDLTEQAFKSRVVERDGSPLPETKRARRKDFPEATISVYKGSGPGKPLFFGKYKNTEARRPVETIDGVTYSDGTVPEDFLTDDQLADSASFEFAPQIDSALTAEGLKPGSEPWGRRAWALKQKYGFDVPFYRRMAKVFNEKYQHITYHKNWPNPYNEKYLENCRLDVYDWYVKQPPGYKDELAGEARGLSWFFSDQTDKMQEMIAKECTVILGSMREAADRAKTADSANMLAFKEAMARGFDAERALLAAKVALKKRIQTDEEKALAEIDRKALELAEKHTTHFAIKYPYTWTTEELLPVFEYDVRSLPTKVKGPVRVTLDQELVGTKEGTPGNWKPGKDYEARFQPDAEGWISTRAVTTDWRFTAHLLDKDSVEITKTTLELPIVVYEPAMSGTITVVVYAMGEKGDSSLYSSALVTLGKDTRVTGTDINAVSFRRLKEGTYSVTVAPSKGDDRHGSGTGSATIVDPLFSKDPKAKDYAGISVKLPYIPPPKVADDKKDDTKAGGAGGTTKGGEKPGDKTGAGGAGGGGAGGGAGGKGGKDSTGAKGGKDSTGAGGGKKPGGPGSGPTIEEIINGLTPLTSKAEKTRDDAKASCKFIEAAAAQEELVAAAKNFIATSFPGGPPAQVQTIAQGFDAELAALKKAATAQEAANVHLRAGRAAVLQRKGEAALTALEAAADVPDIPQCLHDQVMKLYNEIKADIEKRMLLINKAVDAANNQCDFAAAQKFGEEVEAEDATLSWVVKELPRIKDLNRKQKSARTLAAQAEQKALEADQAATGGDKAGAKALYDAALELARQALQVAPECEKDNLKNLLELPARKAAVDAPKVDQSLILLLDTSGSMRENNKMENAKQAATNAVKSLGPTTEVALISYDGGCDGFRVVQDFTTDRDPVIAAIATLQPGGGTPTAPAIGFAHAYMQKNARSKSAQIILMTDGQNSCGSMTDAGAGIRSGNIPVRVDAVGFGLEGGSQAQKDLGDLVRAAGNGNSYSANNAAELISAFRRAFITNQIKPRDPFVSGSAGTRLSELFAAAVAALKQNDIRGAMGQFKTAVDQFPTSPAAQFNASLAYEAGGQPLQAMNYAKKYLELAPNAFDAGQVRERLVVLEKEQAENPRAIYSPNDCGTLYRWAQREVKQAGDAARKAKVYDIMTTAQRGDCAAAQTAHEAYVKQYGTRP